MFRKIILALIATAAIGTTAASACDYDYSSSYSSYSSGYSQSYYGGHSYYGGYNRGY